MCTNNSFHIISQKHDVQEKDMEHEMCFVISLQRLSEIFLIPRRIQWDIINVHTLVYIKYPLLLSDLNENWILSTDFLKIIKLNISRKSFQWESCCSTRTDGQTDRHDHDNWRFSKYCERAKKWNYFLFWKCIFVFTFRFPTKCNGIRCVAKWNWKYCAMSILWYKLVILYLYLICAKQQEYTSLKSSS
jgi:hypothetical protein